MKQQGELFHDGGRYHTETSPLIYIANQWTGFYVISASAMKELIAFHALINLSTETFFERFLWQNLLNETKIKT